MGRGQQGIFATGDITTHRMHRHMPVPEDHTGQRLDFKVGHGDALCLRKIAHLSLRELDIAQVLLGQLSEARINFGRCEPEIRTVPAVEPT